METLQRTANRGSVVTDPEAITVDHSLKIDIANDETLKTNDTWAALTSTSTQKGTVSFWIKRVNTSARPASTNFFIFSGSNPDRANSIFFGQADKLEGSFSADGNGANFATTQVFRDTNAWYHIVMAIDTTDSTALDRIKLYVNGERITNFTTAPDIDQNHEMTMFLGDSGWHGWGTSNSYANTDGSLSAYLAEVNFVDGQQLEPSDFGLYDEDSGIWVPAGYVGTYGVRGYYLEFKVSSELARNTAGTATNALNDSTGIDALDQAEDTPTNNWCTLNGILNQGLVAFQPRHGGTNILTGGNMAQVGSFAVNKGKWYWEGVTTAISGTNTWVWGINRIDAKQGNSASPMSTSMTGWINDGTFQTSTSTTTSSLGNSTGFSSPTAGQIWSISLTCDTSPYQMTFRFDNSVAGTTANNTNRSCGSYVSADYVFPCCAIAANMSGNTHHNFGNSFISALSGGNADANGHGDFKFAPPSGFFALCSENLKEFG